jgi:molybdopterin molybdotransferase
VLPENADTVIRYEDLIIQNGQASILIEAVGCKQNIHLRGTDCKKGTLLASPPCKISAAEIGVAATIGKTHLKVARKPKTVIISTGDELVEVSETPLSHQIRKSNVYQIQAALQQWGIPADTLHLNDDKTEIHSKLEVCLEKYDALLLSGAVSKGKFDFVPEVLEALGVAQLFHKVAQRPGKPFWFGKAEKKALVFAFPGNPVSSFMCTHRYFRPWLRASSGLEPFEKQYALLATDFEFKPNLTYFLQVRISHQKGGTALATPVKGKGSGDLANMLKADGFLELPPGKASFKKGEVYPLILYR